MPIFIAGRPATLLPTTLFAFAPASFFRDDCPQSRPILLLSDAFLGNPLVVRARCRDFHDVIKLCNFLNEPIAATPELMNHLTLISKGRKSRLPSRYTLPAHPRNFDRHPPNVIFRPVRSRSGGWQIAAMHARGRLSILTSFRHEHSACQLANTLNNRAGLPDRAWRTHRPAHATNATLVPT